MKVEVKKVDAFRRELKFEISKDRVSKKLDEVYADLSKVAKIKGFRPGKAPRHILETHHSKVAQEETIKKLIPEVYQEGVVQEKIDPVDLPEIADVSFRDGIITFTAKLDIKPEVKITNYKEIKVLRKSSQASEEEINKMLEYLKKGQGDTEKEVVIDDSFARGLGFPSLEDLRKSIARQIEMDKERQNKIDVENQIVDELLGSAKVAVPSSLVKKQLEHRLAEIKRRLKAQGMSEEEVKKREEEVRKELQGIVERDVKAFFVLEKIAELEGMTFKEGESMPAKVMEFLLKEAKWEEK
ncbi:MAG: trigger factor [Candidatus Omnitrophota bacterium]